jgi:PAS domain S-box-containing protein
MPYSRLLLPDGPARPPRRIRPATLPAILGTTFGALAVFGWLPGGAALHFAGGTFDAPLPTRGLLLVLSGCAILAQAERSIRWAHRLALAGAAVGCLMILSVLLDRLLPPDVLIVQRHLGNDMYVPGILTLVQAMVGMAVPVSILAMARPVVGENRLLGVTAAGLLMIGGAFFMAVVQATRLATDTRGIMGPVSVHGIVASLAFGVSLFLLVADRQETPRIPPRWAPELAGVLSVACTIGLWRALLVQSPTTTAHADILATLALFLGLAVSTLLWLALRLLRSNWHLARDLTHRRISFALETATDGLWEHDLVTGRDTRSAAQLRHLGYEPSDAAEGRIQWMSLVHPDDLEQVQAVLLRHEQRDEDTGEVAYRVRAANGRYHTIVDRGRVVARSGAGGAHVLIGISADITERIAADRSRRETERRYRAIFDSALQGQVLLDDSGRCLEVNSTAVSIAGGDRHEVIGRPFVEGPWFTGLSDAQVELRAHFARAVEGESVRFELDTHLLDGRLGQLECSMTPLSCDTGRVVQVLCELRDVTERRRTEDALREIGALTTMGRLAARVAHEINNPLAGIQNAFLLLADAIPAEHPHRRFLLSIEREIQRIAGVTRSLYETYRHDDAPGAPGSLALAVQDAVTFLDQVNRGRAIAITTDVAAAPAVVPVPDALLRQTLYNLVQNAVEASPTGGTVTVAVREVQGECVITVHDQGAPVPANIRDRLFEPFGQARVANARTGSMGIGLALVRQSVHAIGGAVRLRESDATGTTFEVRLPMTSVLTNGWRSSARGVPAQSPLA